ncbi:hypothetical protein [Pseudomonas sp. NA-150]|uniref:hypothetical protein n=1 Tax=Pseudomonas sp. NA-150 TaxID=3367525 RepID=UPI0037CA8A98
MKSVIALFLMLLLTAVSATALAMPCANGQRVTDDTHDSPHLMRLFVAQVDAGQAQDC